MSTKIFDSENFFTIISRLMLALNVQKEYEVAALLGFKKDTFSARKKRGALPEDKIKLLCAKKLINFDWVMTGKGLQSSQDACDYPIHGGVFPKEFDPDLLLQVTNAIDDIVKKSGVIIPKDRLTKVTMLAYADSFWRGRNVNLEYLEHIIEVASFKDGILTRERVFLEAASVGFVIGEQLPEVKGWLDRIKVVEITVEKSDDGDNIVTKILKKLGIKTESNHGQRSRQLKSVFESIYEDYRYFVVIINDAHLLSKPSLLTLKAIHEITDNIKKFPGIILLGPLDKLLPSINSVQDISQRSILLNNQSHLVEWKIAI